MSRTSLGAYIAAYSSFLKLGDDGISITCTICHTMFQCARKRDLDRHINSKMHKDNTQASVSDSEFSSDLCQAFVAANIPFHKLNNDRLKSFMEKYCGRKVPDESTLRKRYLQPTYDKKIQEIRQALENNYIWIMVDEATDIQGHTVANVIAGPLYPDKRISPYLVASRVLEKTNSETITYLVCNSLDNITYKYPSKVLLLITHVSTYMLEAGQTLSKLMPRMIHLTSFACALHHVCEYIKEEFSDVDKLISETEKIFLKSPNRQMLFKELCPHLQLPPKPVLTRYSTWLEAAMYYANNFNDIKEFISQLEGSVKSVAECKRLINVPHLSEYLNFIKEHFSNIPPVINQLESRDLSLPDSVDLFNSTLESFKFSHDFAQRLSQEITDVIVKRNPGYGKMCEISTLLKVKSEDASDELLQYYRYAPVTSCEVERSFSFLKDICTYFRHYTPENMERYMIIHYKARSDISNQIGSPDVTGSTSK